ncbi:hypothetical protein M404DRAFT_31931 [Pisolithus tinctorius Marx 270]|uniref:Uncharacterized protein n=1 Tax=Pisolithus tinctorius Marx 270 TaxID=870435 RepID=A0A0C3N9U5_PISTI|nr:hypothetical protein M404DRAFT_31931 [Pisolithus tinctorius Marx 270]
MPSQAGSEVTNEGEEDDGAGFDEAMLGFGDEQTGGDESPGVNMDSASVQGDTILTLISPLGSPSCEGVVHPHQIAKLPSLGLHCIFALLLHLQSLWDSSSKTSSTKPSSTLTKHGKSQLQDQVIDLSHKAESLVASSSRKTKCYMVKMEYLHRKEELMKEQAEMATKMELELEAKKLDIQLMKAQEITFNSEAEMLRLKIKLVKLMKANLDATPPTA